MLDAALAAELLTSLCLAQLVTDAAFGRGIRPLPAATLLASLVLGSVSRTWLPSGFAAPPLDAAALLAPLIYATCSGVLVGWSLSHQRRPRLWHAVAPLPLVLVAWSLRASWAPSQRSAAKLWLLAVTHGVACWYDCRRSTKAPLGLRDFCEPLAEALAYVAPAYPLLVVLGSAALLFGTSTLRLFGLNPEHLRWVVLWGAMHAPFWCVHLRTRQLCAGGASRGVSALPLPLVAEQRQRRWEAAVSRRGPAG